MSFNQIMQELKAKKYKPVYFLHGAESYFIDKITDYIDQNVLSEGEKAFNQTVLYGKEVDHKTVLDVARRFPMMAPYQVVILKEAQEMKSLKELQSYIEKPADSTILLIAYKHKTFRFNSKFGKALKDKAVVLHAKRMYDNQVPDWIQSYLKQKKLKINNAAAQLIGEYLGTKLSNIANELDKLALNLPEGTEVNTQHIEENIGISKDFNVFELQKALGQRDVLKANRIILYFIANPKKNPLPMIFGALYNYFSKVYQLKFMSNSPEQELLQALKLRSAYFLRDYKMAAKNFSKAQIERVFEVLREYDLKSKGVDFIATGKEDGALLKEAIWKILH